MFLRGFTETRSVIQISVSMPISVDSAITVDFVLAGCYSRFDVQVSFTYLGLGGSAERSHSMDHENYSRAANHRQSKASQTNAEF